MFRNANLQSSDLTRAVLVDTALDGADLTNATVGWGAFGNIDLSSVKGLCEIQHQGPSSIGIDTLLRSKGAIPENFLRGAGVPDALISYSLSLVTKSPAFHSCFISYSNNDQLFVERLYSDLQNKGVRCWFAPEDLKIGEKFRHRIDESIRTHDKLLLVLSQQSIQSKWVETELEAAFEKEQRGNATVLFPIRLDDAVMECDQAWAAEIRRTRHIGDFTQWTDSTHYAVALQRLVRDLRTAPLAPA